MTTKSWRKSLYDYQCTMALFGANRIPPDTGVRAAKYRAEVMKNAPSMRQFVYKVFGVPWRGTTWLEPEIWGCCGCWQSSQSL